MSFTNNARTSTKQEFVGIDELLDTNEFNNLKTATKVPLFRDNGMLGYTKTRFETIMCGGEEICPVSKRYEIVQHQDAFLTVLNGLNKASIEATGRICDFGHTAWMDLKYDNLRIEDPASSQGIELGCSIKNSFNKESGYLIFPYAIRGICSNGMIFKDTADLNIPVLSIRHMGDVIAKIGDRLKDMLQNTIKSKNVYMDLFNRATNETFRFSCEDELTMTIASYGISEKRVKEMLKRGSFNLDHTNKYEIVNCITEYANHEKLSNGLYESMLMGAEKCLNECELSTKIRITNARIAVETQ